MTLEHAAAQADVEEAQNEQLLNGNLQILQRVETLEGAILALERQIKTAIDHLDGAQSPHS